VAHGHPRQVRAVADGPALIGTLEVLHPGRGTVETARAYADLRLSELAPLDRPYVIANMVATADGRATLAGRTEQISCDTDRALFLALRTQVDAVMAGPATIGIERYGPIMRSEERREQRHELGLEPVPLAVTASRSMVLPVDAPLFMDPGSRIVVLTNSNREPPPVPADLVVERIPGKDLDLVAGFTRLRDRHRVRLLLVEGGPTLLAAVVAAGALDELFLTLAPKLVGGGGEIGVLEGAALAAPLELELRSVLEEESFLFLRYAVGRRSDPARS
jgi:riboflavin biosynthesis pyrimidine reductase